MKNTDLQFAAKLFLFVVSLFMLGLSTSYAQIGNLGIYGSAPTGSGMDLRYVRLDPYPDIGCESCEYVLPLNGLKNFNFYYTVDGLGFLSGGSYRLTYLDASLVPSGLRGEIVSYTPNADHTNGVTVRDFNPVPTGQPTPLGIHGVIRGYDLSGAVVPIKNALVRTSIASYIVFARTNGNGFFSVYYANEGPVNQFLYNAPHPSLLIHTIQNGCSYSYFVPPHEIVWAPDTNSSSPGYYVTDAAWNIGSPILPCGSIDEEEP